MLYAAFALPAVVAGPQKSVGRLARADARLQPLSKDLVAREGRNRPGIQAQWQARQDLIFLFRSACTKEHPINRFPSVFVALTGSSQQSVLRPVAADSSALRVRRKRSQGAYNYAVFSRICCLAGDDTSNN